MSRLPSALVIGPMKAGTTWIHDYLAARRDVGLSPQVKETFFFDRHYDKGVDWYAGHFAGLDASACRLTMEVAPSYFHCAQAPERVASTLGHVPLVVTLRDPVRRAWSHYLHLRRYGYTTAPLQQAAADYPAVLEASRYKTVLARWQQALPESPIFMLWQEGLADSPEQYAQDLCNALGLPYVAPAGQQNKPSNAAAVPPSAKLAGLGRRTSYFLRDRKLYGVVNFAKRLGLKQLFFGKPGNAELPELSEADAQWLAEQLGGELPEDCPGGFSQGR